MYEDVKHFVPVWYMTKSITTHDRRFLHSGSINGQWTEFHIIAKLERNLPPRDEGRVMDAIYKLVKDTQKGVGDRVRPYEYLLDILLKMIHRKHVAGLGK